LRLKNRKDDINAKGVIEQNPMENLQNGCFVEQCHDKTSAVEDSVLTNAPASCATVGKRKRKSTSLENGNDNDGTLKKKKYD
jgi:hypothetical protein